jgi:hypothetical protein
MHSAAGDLSTDQGELAMRDHMPSVCRDDERPAGPYLRAHVPAGGQQLETAAVATADVATPGGRPGWVEFAERRFAEGATSVEYGGFTIRRTADGGFTMSDERIARRMTNSKTDEVVPEVAAPAALTSSPTPSRLALPSAPGTL